MTAMSKLIALQQEVLATGEDLFAFAKALHCAEPTGDADLSEVDKIMQRLDLARSEITKLKIYQTNGRSWS